ncbi:MAG: 50S ribosomal protein L11 methyltransferase [Hyphomicrobiaceae bacterium]|nr:50S ribosomal protein L11 methyltransferase [Hyphomicrobiaceae bacterium]
MSSSKIVIAHADRDAAYRIAGAMQDLMDPAPDALTLFEEPGSGWRIDAYYGEPPAPPALHAALVAILGSQPLADARIESDGVPDLNWVALSQAALPPVKAGRFTVHGSHDRSRVPQGPGALLIEAGEAFGTAHHATTFGCLQALDRLTQRRRFKRVLDLGCGSGVLAIAASRALPAARITATDIDVPSVAVARDNARLNRAGRRIDVIAAEGLDHARLRTQRFDLALANILADPLIALSRSLARAVVPGGAVVLSGILVRQAPAVMAAYRTAGFRIVHHARINEWSTLELQRDDGRPHQALARSATSHSS